jgi:uncharacterized repeat protein (TIGR01451 family)
MSIPHRLCFATRFCQTIVLAVSILLVTSAASAAGPSLWLYPMDAGPREGGHVVAPGEFVLVIENRGKDPDADAAHEVKLVIAVDNLDGVSSLSLDGTPVPLEPTEWDEGTPLLPCSDKPMPRHGVFPTTYTTIDLEDLEGGASFEIEVAVEGDDNLNVHFDAMAFGLKTTGRSEKCFAVSNPPGHDVTVANRRGGKDSCGGVSITKTAEPSAIDSGETVLFTIEILNNGTCELTELILRDFIPAVEDEAGIDSPAFRPFDDTVPPYLSEDGLELEWPFDSPLPVDESLIIELHVVFDDPLVDQQKVVNRACVSAAELRKKRCAAAVVTVGNPYGDDGPAGPGFWCHATRWILEERSKLPVEGEELLTWLGNVDAGSDVFSELYPIFFEEDAEASLAAAAELLCTPQSAAGAADRLARHLLVLWLNVISGRLDEGVELGELCTGDEVLPDGEHLSLTIGQFLDLVDEGFEGADDGQLTFWSEVVDAINNSYVAGEGECRDRRTVSSRHRAGNGGPQGKSAVSKTKD